MAADSREDPIKRAEKYNVSGLFSSVPLILLGDTDFAKDIIPGNKQHELTVAFECGASVFSIFRRKDNPFFGEKGNAVTKDDDIKKHCSPCSSLSFFNAIIAYDPEKEGSFEFAKQQLETVLPLLHNARNVVLMSVSNEMSLAKKLQEHELFAAKKGVQFVACARDNNQALIKACEMSAKEIFTEILDKIVYGSKKISDSIKKSSDNLAIRRPRSPDDEGHSWAQRVTQLAKKIRIV